MHIIIFPIIIKYKLVWLSLNEKYKLYYRLVLKYKNSRKLILSTVLFCYLAFFINLFGNSIDLFSLTNVEPKSNAPPTI